MEELNRRLDAIGCYIDSVNDRNEANARAVAPPYPNRLLRRQQIKKDVDRELFSANIQDLHDSVPPNYTSAEFVRQLIEGDECPAAHRSRRE